MALAALLALTWQSLVVQTHVHPGIVRAAAQGHPGTGLVSIRHAPDPEPATCPICRQLTQSGHYLTPTAPVVVGASAIVAILQLALPPRQETGPRSHSWRSRGPPNAVASR